MRNTGSTSKPKKLMHSRKREPIEIASYFFAGASPKNTKGVTKSIPASLYRNIHASVPVVCVDIVIRQGKRFLLVKRNNKPARGEYFVPGGRVLKNETLEAAALRKLKQETGLAGRIKKSLGAATLFWKEGYYPGFSSHMIVFVFLMDIHQKTSIVLDSQGSAFRWFEKIPPKTSPYIRDFLRKAGFR